MVLASIVCSECFARLCERAREEWERAGCTSPGRGYCEFLENLMKLVCG